MTTKEFADRINLGRTSVYHIYKQDSIHIERLKLISKALDYDFIAETYQQTSPPRQTIFIAIEVDAESIQSLNLPADFIRLIKSQK